MNGKELPHLRSFLKFHSHGFLKSLRNINPLILENFKVDKAYLMNSGKGTPRELSYFTLKIIYQKLDYIHKTHVGKKMMLPMTP